MGWPLAGLSGRAIAMNLPKLLPIVKKTGGDHFRRAGFGFSAIVLGMNPTWLLRLQQGKDVCCTGMKLLV
jgi:hypothetical protein